jgi:hypothetical protein
MLTSLIESVLALLLIRPILKISIVFLETVSLLVVQARDID